MVKKISILMIVAFVFLGIGALAEAQVNLRCATVAPETAYTGQTVKMFADKAGELSKGAMKITVYYFAQLGGEQETMQMAKLGSLDMLFASDGICGAFMEEWKTFNLPFLVKGMDQYKKFMDQTETGKKFLASAEAYGYVMPISRPLSFRFVTNNVRPITKPEDFKGIRMRTQQNPIQMDTMKALGASATTIPFPELYTALQTGVVEGQYNEDGAIWERKFYEVQKFMTEMPLFPSLFQVVFSKKVYDALSPENKKILNEAAKIAGEYCDKVAPEGERGYRKQIEASGKLKINILDKAQIPAFQKALAPVYEKTQKEYPKISPYVEWFLKN
jgi:TRAP-type transport system periplasmic protein